MNRTVAVLIDIMSIQRYIFSSNKLKMNLGASYIIETLFNDFKDDKSIKEIVYTGGGNALLYFDNKENASKFLKQWSKKTLIEYPGLHINCSIDDNFDTSNFKGSLDRLYKKLNNTKGKVLTNTSISSYGFNAECNETGLSQENCFEDGQYISKEAYVKIKASKKADERLMDKYKDILQDYKFTNELDKLGSSKGEDSHIAVVHIDGNGIGEKFKECKTGEERRKLSEGLKKTVEESFKYLLQHIIDNYDNISDELSLDGKILPIRPIVLGGDDITFVCDAKLGVYLAKLYMEEFRDLQGNNLSSCAGVSIVKMKYPFYSAYQMAEELCSNAKKTRKENKDNGSWIDFNIAYGNMNMSLHELREKHFKIDNKALTMRPYKLKRQSNEINIDLEDIIKGIKEFRNWPNSKLKKLREVLYEGDESREHFRIESEIRGRKIPEIGEGNYSNLFYDNKTSYLDIIELQEYYPKFALQEV